MSELLFQHPAKAGHYVLLENALAARNELAGIGRVAQFPHFGDFLTNRYDGVTPLLRSLEKIRLEEGFS
jgi:hypothetical protein